MATIHEETVRVYYRQANIVKYFFSVSFIIILYGNDCNLYLIFVLLLQEVSVVLIKRVQQNAPYVRSKKTVSQLMVNTVASAASDALYSYWHGRQCNTVNLWLVPFLKLFGLEFLQLPFCYIFTEAYTNFYSFNYKWSTHLETFTLSMDSVFRCTEFHWKSIEWFNHENVTIRSTD